MVAWLLFYSGLFLLIGLAAALFLQKRLSVTVQRDRVTAIIWFAAAIWGAFSLHITLRLQLPIQLAYMRLVGTRLTSSLSGYITYFPVALISGLVQELLKALPFALLFLFRYRRSGLAQFFAAAGLGFGVWEAIWLAALPLAQYGGWYAPAVFERTYAIIFHIAATFITGYGFAAYRPLRYYLAAALLHGAINFGAVLHSGRILGLWQTEMWGLAWALATLLIAWVLGRKLPYTKEA